MKKPAQAPTTQAIMEGFSGADLSRVMANNSPTDDRGRYLHWDKLRHLTPPQGLSVEQWWLGVKLARVAMFKNLPLLDIAGQPFKYAMPDSVQRELHWLDRYAAGSIQSNEAITNRETRNTYLIRSLVEEAINSSQLEGASTTRDVAKEMIRQEREPEDQSERMILNNYRAMQFIREFKDEPLTPAIVFELHRLLTEGTLDKPSAAGCFRSADDNIHVVDAATNEYLHTPPPADQLSERMAALCDFANATIERSTADKAADNTFLHPVVKAIALHFMLSYDHPFYDGNGRTARALFYWAMAKAGYWLVEYVSISEVIKQAPVQYGRAYLHTETDDNDMTYFLIHQLDVIHQSINALHAYLDEKAQAIGEAERMLVENPRLKGQLNFRQLSLLRHALKHPRFSYVVQEHQQSHGVSYDVARKDLLRMSDTLGLLDKTKRGKQYYFVVPSDLEKRINSQ